MIKTKVSLATDADAEKLKNKEEKISLASDADAGKIEKIIKTKVSLASEQARLQR